MDRWTDGSQTHEEFVRGEQGMTQLGPGAKFARRGVALRVQLANLGEERDGIGPLRRP